MKRGFTLIELLAVIVILAIIALIATPIVLNIINETKDSAGLRSAEMYLRSVEQEIASAQLDGKKIETNTYNILENGNICLEEYTRENGKYVCKDSDENPDNNELIIEVKGEKPNSGSIYVCDGNIENVTINLENKTIIKDLTGNLFYENKLLDICKLESGIEMTMGAKYTCKVDPNNEPYTFYVLTTPKEGDNSINLIMDSNINESGVAIKSNDIEDKGLVAWYADEKNNSYGPITAIEYLAKATKNWINLTPIKINKFDSYDDDGNFIDTHIMKTYNVYARMPYISELEETNCNFGDPLSCPSWIGNYLNDASNEVPAYQQYTIVGICGYWTFSSPSNLNQAFYVNYIGTIMSNFVDGDEDFGNIYGVRPVITLKL